MAMNYRVPRALRAAAAMVTTLAPIGWCLP
jgi:hypothetical protein